MKRAWKAAAIVATGLATAAAMAGQASAQASLEARLKAVEDRLAIIQLMEGDYPRALDSANWKAYAATFTENGVLVVGANEIKGRAAIEANFSRPRTPRAPAAGAAAAPAPAPAPAAGAAPAAPRRNMHVVSNITIQLNGDKAKAQGYWETISSRDGRAVVAGGGHYEDELEKVNGKWLFSRRAILNDVPPPQPRPAAGAAGATPPARPPAQ